MATDDYSRSMTLLCSTSGGRDFEYDEEMDDGPVRCTKCDRTFARDELISENQARIDNKVEDIGKQVMDDLTKSLGRALKGSKHIKFK